MENAKSLIDATLTRFDRYDLSQVGRFKLNQRLGLDSQSRLLELQDIIAILKEVIRLNNLQNVEPDDIDHLGNRRVRPVGELLQNKLRVGLARMRRIVQDRMSTLDINTITPGPACQFPSGCFSCKGIFFFFAIVSIYGSGKSACRT